MSKITFEPLPQDDVAPIDLDMMNLYSTAWIDITLVCLVLFTIVQVIKRLK
tara:strand:- start:440 stop:592 length:153 start_codon:yes stop_codon:yes gene_type:complete